MNEELQKQLAGVLESARAVGKDAYAFIQEQAPELCRELVQWAIAEGAIYTLGGVMALAAALYLFFSIKKYAANDQHSSFDVDAAWVFGGMIIAVLLLVAGAGLAVGPLQVAKGIFAPRLVVLEAISRTVK